MPRSLVVPLVLAAFALPAVPAHAAALRLEGSTSKSVASATEDVVSLEDLAAGPGRSLWQLETWSSDPGGFQRVLVRYDRNDRVLVQRALSPRFGTLPRLGRLAVAPDGTVYTGGPRRVLQRRSGRTARVVEGWRLRGAPGPADAQARPADVAVAPDGSVLAAVGGAVERFGRDGRWRSTLLAPPIGAGAARAVTASPGGRVAVLHGAPGGRTLLTVLRADGDVVTPTTPLALEGVSGVELPRGRVVVRHALRHDLGALSLLDASGRVVASTPSSGRARVRFSAMSFTALAGGRLAVTDDRAVRSYRLVP